MRTISERRPTHRLPCFPCAWAVSSQQPSQRDCISAFNKGCTRTSRRCQAHQPCTNLYLLLHSSLVHSPTLLRQYGHALLDGGHLAAQPFGAWVRRHQPCCLQHIAFAHIFTVSKAQYVNQCPAHCAWSS